MANCIESLTQPPMPASRFSNHVSNALTALLFGLACALPPQNLGYAATITDEQKALFYQVVSVFENNTPEIQYDYVAALGDGRGYTAGKAGFTSATGDMLLVVQRYTEAKPDNPLARFRPQLAALLEQHSGAIVNLELLPAAWKLASEDPLFRQIQNEVCDELYLSAAIEKASELGLQYPLGVLILYDTAIQHGNGTDPDSLSALVQATTDLIGGIPMQGYNEHDWLHTFVEIREQHLLEAADPATREVWAASVGRVRTLHELVDIGEYQLELPLVINPWGTAFELRASVWAAIEP